MAAYYLITELPPLEGISHSSASSINNSGQVVGDSDPKTDGAWAKGVI
jgi:uncharacterized membrane protein